MVLVYVALLASHSTLTLMVGHSFFARRTYINEQLSDSFDSRRRPLSLSLVLIQLASQTDCPNSYLLVV